MFLEDPFRNDLLCDESVRRDLQFMSRGQSSLLPYYLPCDDFCITLTFGIDRILVCDPKQLPSDAELHPLIHNALAENDGDSSISTGHNRVNRGALPSQRHLRHHFPTACFMYVPEVMDPNHEWIIGSVLSDRTCHKYLFLMGLMDLAKSDADGFNPVFAKFFVSRKTGNQYEVLHCKNGYTFVSRMSNFSYRFQLASYEPGNSILEPGAMIRKYECVMLTACLRCFPPPSLNAPIHSAVPKLVCRCARPALPTIKHPLLTWLDISNVYVENFHDNVGFRVLYDRDGNIILSDIYVRTATISRASREGLSLFSVLVMNEIKPIPLNGLLVKALESIFVQDYNHGHGNITLALSAAHLVSKHDLVEMENERNQASGCLLDTARLDSRDKTTEMSKSTPSLAAALSVPMESFACDDCGRVFGHKHNLLRHVRLVHENSRRFKCEHCDGEFKLRSHLVTHFRLVHLKEKSFECAVCSRKFGTSTNLQRHRLEMHERLKPFECRDCGRRFGSKFNLTRHMLRHQKSESDTT